MLLDPIPTLRHRHTEKLGVLDRVRFWRPTPLVATFTICCTALAYATTSIFVRQLTATGMSVVAVAFFRFALTSAVLVRFVNVAPHARSATRWGLISGTAIGLGWIVYVNTITDADVAIAGVVQMTYPLFAVISGWIFFATRPGLRAWLAGTLIIVAAAIGLGVGSGIGAGTDMVSLLVMFIAPATFGFSVAILAERLGPLDPFERLAAVSVGATVAMSPLLLSLPVDQVVPQSVSALGWVIAIGAVSALLPMIAYAAAAPVVGTARTVAAGSLELPALFIIGATVFGEEVHLRHLLAAALIIGAIVLSSSSRAPHVIPDDDVPVDPATSMPASIEGQPSVGRPTSHPDLTLEF